MWQRLLHEPLVHFAALAALLFGAQVWLRGTEGMTIRVDRVTIDALAQQHAEIRGRPLDPDERAALVESFVDDQVLLREAYRLGLDQDAVVRRHLVQKMRFVLGEDVEEPSEADLQAYLEGNPERFRSPPSVTVEHVYFADPAAVPDDQLARLQGGLDFRGLGDRLFMLGSTLPRYDRQNLEGLLGADAADQIMVLPPGEWHGPLASPHGAHFVRVVERHPAHVPEVEEIADYLRQDWILTRQQAAVSAKVAELRQGYRIVIGPPAATDP